MTKAKAKRKPKTTVSVYEISEGQWFAAESLVEAIVFASEQMGADEVERALTQGKIKCMSQIELKGLSFYDDDTNSRRSFAKQLERIINSGELNTPTWFASEDA